jgi:putative cell wall-binding protein
VEISQAFEPGVERVYLATGEGYADALSAGPAAAQFDGPLLLTTPGSLPASVLAELERLAPAEVIVVGGTSVISNAVISQVEGIDSQPQVERIFGGNRYETSRLLAADAFGAGSVDTAYIATGTNFPDALSAGPAAAHFDGPVVLVPGSAGTVDAATLALLDTLGVETVKIAGGTAIVSSGIESQLAGIFGDEDVDRNAGGNRYETAVAINADEFTTAPKVFLATGSGYADALAGAALAGFENAPLFVVESGCIPQSVLNALIELGTTEVVLLGGIGALGEDVAELTGC